MPAVVQAEKEKKSREGSCRIQLTISLRTPARTYRSHTTLSEQNIRPRATTSNKTYKLLETGDREEQTRMRWPCTQASK